MKLVKKYFNDLYKNAESLNLENIETLLNKHSNGNTILDIGCWDGVNTVRWAKASGSKNVIGIETVEAGAKKAEKKKIKVLRQDIDLEKWKLKSSSVDVVVSNLVIEHLSDVDHYISEISRVLKTGGIAVIATNNLSSWHNIISLLLGWAPFDMVNSSRKSWGIGNPMALHRNEALYVGETFSHKCVYNALWLKEWFDIYGLELVDQKGAGYYPLPATFGNYDKKHCAFMSLVFRKK